MVEMYSFYLKIQVAPVLNCTTIKGATEEDIQGIITFEENPGTKQS